MLNARKHWPPCTRNSPRTPSICLSHSLSLSLSLSARHVFYHVMISERYSECGGCHTFCCDACLSATDPQSILGNSRQYKLPVCHQSSWCRCFGRRELLGSGINARGEACSCRSICRSRKLHRATGRDACSPTSAAATAITIFYCVKHYYTIRLTISLLHRGK